MKDSTVRINDVLAFIQNAAGFSVHTRQAAHHFVNSFVTAHYPAGNAGQGPYETFSKAMGQGAHLGNNPHDVRGMKRACYLIDQALHQKVPAATAFGQLATTQISNSEATHLFRGYMHRAAHMRDQETGGTQSLVDVLQDLRNSPRTLMKRSKFLVRGTDTRDLAQGDQNILPFHFHYDQNFNRYVFSGGVWAGSTPVAVDSITAVAWTQVPGSYVGAAIGNFAQIPAIELASNIMVTTQFTGCSFCMKRTNGQVYCAHVGPKRDPTANVAPVLTGTQLAQRVALSNGVHGNFANAAGGGQLSVYGSGYTHNVVPNGYPIGLGAGSDYMTVIGVQIGADYKIYSQVTQNHAISSTQRIF